MPGATEEAISEVEHRLHVTFPPELHELYRATNGIKSWDSYTVRLWPLKRLARVIDLEGTWPSETGAELVVFADFGLDAEWYAVDLGGGTRRGDVASVADSTIGWTRWSWLEALAGDDELRW